MKTTPLLLPTPPMAAHVGYRLIKIGEQLMDRAEQALAPINIKPRHFNVLVTLASSHDLSQQDLSRVLNIDVNAMVGVIDFLEDQGLAVRERNPNDRRRHVMKVTEAGMALIQRGEKRIGAAESDYVSTLDPAERKILDELTAKLLGLPAQQ